MKLFQPNIFDTPSIAYNKAIKKLMELDAISARACLEKYNGYASKENLDLEYAFIDFIDDWAVKDALNSDPETGMELWDQWLQTSINRFPVNKKQKELIGRMSRAYFQRLSLVFLEQCGAAPDDHFIKDGGAIRCLMQGEFWEKAMKLSRQVIRHSDEPGKLLGYMGDCAFNMGMKSAARDAYLQACLLAPYQIDIRFTADLMVKELVTDPGCLCDEYDMPHGPWRDNIGWAGATGIITGIFPVIPVKTLNPVINLEDIFFSYEHCMADRPAEDRHYIYNDMTRTKMRIKGQAFAAGLILSFQSRTAENFDNIMKHYDIADIKRVTKRISPELFSMALARLVK